MTHFTRKATLPDAIFLDWDGTIANSYEFLNRTYNYVLTTLGMEPFEEGEYRQYFGIGTKDERFEKIFGYKKDEAYELYKDYVMNNNHTVRPYEGVAETLGFLQKKDVLTGVVTNKKSDVAQKEAEHMNLAQFLPVIIGSGDAEEDKPSAAPLRLAIRKAGFDINKDEIWYVGDSNSDATCAYNAGCPFLFREYPEGDQILPENYNPLVTFSHYSELMDFFKHLSQKGNNQSYAFS